MGGTAYGGSRKTLILTSKNVSFFKGQVGASFLPHQQNYRSVDFPPKEVDSTCQFGSDSDSLCTLNNKQLNSRSGKDGNAYRHKNYLVERRISIAYTLKGFNSSIGLSTWPCTTSNVFVYCIGLKCLKTAYRVLAFFQELSASSLAIPIVTTKVPLECWILDFDTSFIFTP